MSKIILQDVRCSYVFVTSERKDGGYGLQVMMKKGSKLHKQLEKETERVLVDGFGQAALRKRGRYKLPLRDGDDEREGEEYEGIIFFNANAAKKPGLVTRANNKPTASDLEAYCYSGAYFTISVTLYSFPAKDGGKPGVAVGLNNVMLRKKGERLDGTIEASKEFEDFADDDFDEDDEDDFDDDF